ncbi:FlgD immunoglobulin-like domain containing protein [Melioribacteraceae bacterium 4301-Me]|uniref:FlgD immunoglobulin-like domain containing protein n=1 Tax=Pyranulibacter aquaticus TaxID=3163344 RepID=UPI0035974EAB
MNFKNIFASIFGVLLFLLFAGTSLAQTTYYVDGVAGNDNWTGTASTFQSGNVGPKKTIQAMLNDVNVVDGDIISIAAATYNETVTLTKRVQLSPSGAVTVQNLTLNTNSSTATTVGNAANNLTITGTLLVQSGKYSLTPANVILASGGTLEVRVTGSLGLQNPITTTSGAFTLTFSNTGAITYTPANLYTSNPGDVNFNGSATVTLGAAVTVVGNLTIASGASVNLNGNNITVQGGSFTNNGSYYGSGAEKVNMTTAGGTISGSGTFQNLTLTGAFTWKIGSNLTFNNVSQSVASLIDVGAGATLDFQNFNISTPGNVTINGAVAYSGAGATTPGTLEFSGSLGTIGTVTFTVPGGGLTIKNLSITKPSGSTVTLASGNLTVDKQLNFTGGIFNIGANNLTLSDNHGGTAAIGGNINGTGTFTIGGGAAVNDITVSGAGQINVPFTVNMGSGKTVTFTQLTTIGNNFTLTSGNMTTSSLQLINGTVTVTNGILTFNTSNLSITNNTTLNGGQLKGSSNITVSGAFAQNATSIVNMTGTLTVSSYTGGGNGDFTAGTTTTSGGNFTTGTGNYTVNGNLVVHGNFTGNTGTVHVTGDASSDGTFTVSSGNLTVDGNLNPTGAFSFTGASVLTVGGSLTGGSTVNFTNAAATAAIGGNLSSVGHLTIGANAVTVGGNLTTTSSGNLVGGAGDLTVTGVANIAGDIQVNTGDIYFQGSGSHTVGGNLLTAVASAGATTDLRFGGPVTISGNPGIQMTADQEWRFDGAVTLNNGTANNIDLATTPANVTIDFYGNVSASNLLLDNSATQTVNFHEGSSLISQLKNISVANTGAAAPTVITVGGTTSGKSHELRISGDITYNNLFTASAFTVNTNGKLVMNGSTGDLKTAANQQVITVDAGGLNLGASSTLEINNTQTDSDPSTNNWGQSATNEAQEAVAITGGTLTVANLILTNNGIDGTNLALAANGTITRSAGLITPGTNPSFGARNLVYTNSSDITTGVEFSDAAGIDDITLSGTGKVTLESGLTTQLVTTGKLTINSGAELANNGLNLTVQSNGDPTGDKAVINGTFSGTGKLIIDVNDATPYNVKGSGGSISNLEFDFAGAAGTIVYSGPATLTGNLTSTGGQGTITYSSTAPSTIGGNFTINVGTCTIAPDLTVTGNFTNTAGATTLSGSLTVGGNYSQAAGTVTLSATKNITINGNYTSTGGTISFPAASTSSIVVKGASLSTSGPTTYTFGAGASGRFIVNGSAAQALTLGNNTTISRFELNNSAGLTMSGAAVSLTVNNLLLTSGTFTHNGLLTMPAGTDRIIRNVGTLASFAAAGPGEVEYISTSNITTGYELPSTLNKLIANASSGNPSYTLDKNVTVLSGGELNLSRGTLVIGSNSLIVQNNSTITRAEGFLNGTPTYGTGETLQYFNTENDITTGPEFTNDGSITTLVVNAPNKQVILGADVTVAGTVNVNFGSINLNGFTFTESAAATLTNNGNITGTGTLKNTGAGAIFTGTATSWPNIVSSNNLTINPTNAATNITLASLSQTAGNFTVGNNVGTLTITGDFSNAGTGTFNDGGKTINFKGNVTIGLAAGGTLTNTGTFVLNGTAAQTLSSTKAINTLTINNSAGVTLASNITIASSGTLTLTSGAVTTGSNYLQVGTTAAGTVNRTSGYIVGNMYRWVDVNASATTNTLFPMGTADGKYRPLTLTFGGGGGSTGSIVRVSHTNAAPNGTVGIPFTTGSITINKLAPAYWTVGMYDVTNTNLQTPTLNPKVTVGMGGFAFGDITKIRAVYRLTNDGNTWQLPGTFDGAFYDINGVATVIHSGVQGWTLEPQELFTVGYQSNFAVANPIADQTLTIGGNPFTKTIQASPAVFSGNIGALTYTVTSSNTAVATASEAGGVLTVTAVSAGTSVVKLLATDVNGDTVSTSFNVTVNAYPTFTAPAFNTVTLNEGQDSTIALKATGQGTITLSLLSGAPAWATFTAVTSDSGHLALAPDFDAAANSPYTITVRATSTNGLHTDKVFTVTVNNVNQAPVWTGTGTQTHASDSVKSGNTLSLTYQAKDLDGVIANYSVSVSPSIGSPNTYSITSLGVFTFTPTFAEAGNTYTFTITATDNEGATANTTTQVKVLYPLAKGDLSGDNAIDAGDASLVLQAVVGKITLTPEQQYAADVDGTPGITAYDAYYILFYSAYGYWPSSSPKASAVTGTVEFNSLSSGENGIINLPLKLTNTSGVYAVTSVVNIDANAIDIVSVSKHTPDNWTMFYNVDNGQLKVAMAGTTPLTDGDVLVIGLKLKTQESVVNLTGSAQLNNEIQANLMANVREVPTSFSMSQNYPNPFNPTTTIKYAIPEKAQVKLTIYNMLGQQIKTLVNTEQDAGFYKVTWDGTNDFGSRVASGIYIYRIEAGKYVSTMKMNLLK